MAHKSFLIRRFKNQDDAMTYYNKAAEDEKAFITKDFEFEIFAVTQKSYREIVKMKSANAYRQFL